MMNTFLFSKDLKIILYGINIYSEHLYLSLCKAGYEVVAFFDNRYQELEKQYPVPVYSLLDHPYKNGNKDEFCVIIMLQNAMQHEPIAMDLLHYGYHKVIFVPMHSKLDKDIALQMRFQYNLLIMEQFTNLKEIPLLDERAIQPEMDSQSSIIRKDGNYHIVWCPSELLYTQCMPREVSKSVRQYSNVPLYAFFPYVSLFEYIRAERGVSQEYLEEYGVHSCKFKNSFTDKSIILQRKKLIDIYQIELNMGMDFFISSAPLAEWNKEFSVFNLWEGHHRSLFLLMQGLRYVPIRISKQNFETWNVNCGKDIIQDYLRNSDTKLPLLHPRYKNINEDSEKNCLIQLQSIQKFLGEEHTVCSGMLQGKSVLDASDTSGYYARNAIRMKARRVTSYNPTHPTLEMEVQASEQIKGIEIIKDWKQAEQKTYDVLFLLDGIKTDSKREKQQWIRKYLDVCTELCFVTICDDAELEIWSDYFSNVKLLRNLFAGGDIVKLYVLKK